MSHIYSYDHCNHHSLRGATNQRPRRKLRSGTSIVSIMFMMVVVTTTMSPSTGIQVSLVGVVSAFHIRHYPHEQQRHISVLTRRKRQSFLLLCLPQITTIPTSACLTTGSSHCRHWNDNVVTGHDSLQHSLQQPYRRMVSLLAATTKNNMDILDAELIPFEDENTGTTVDKNIDHNDMASSQPPPPQPATTTTTIRPNKSLLDLSFELDEEFMNSRIPFVDTTVPTDTGSSTIGKRDSSSSSSSSNEAMATTTITKNNYIDVKLAFMVTLDNVQYGIGIPYDTAAAITYEQPDGTIEYISPDVRMDGNNNNDDNDDMTELIAIMATQLQEYIGTDVQLQHTPRVLTISGNMDQYTKDWERTLLPQAINATLLLETLVATPNTSTGDRNEKGDSDDDDDPQLAFFHNLMKEELGQAEYDKIMNDDDESEEMQELMKLFDSPLGTNDNTIDDAAMNELLSTILTPEQELENAKKSFGLLDPQAGTSNNGYMALKLISYMFANGKSYSLVQLLQPYVIVGKYVLVTSSTRSDNDDNVDDSTEDDGITEPNENVVGYFELLLPDEESIVIPRLEAVCSAELQQSNLQFRS